MAEKRNTLATLGETPVGDQTYEPPPAYGFMPPQLPPIDFNLQTLYGNLPRAQGGISLPLLGNELQLRGMYQHDPYAPQYGLQFGLRRQF